MRTPNPGVLFIYLTGLHPVEAIPFGASGFRVGIVCFSLRDILIAAMIPTKL